MQFCNFIFIKKKSCFFYIHSQGNEYRLPFVLPSSVKFLVLLSDNPEVVGRSSDYERILRYIQSCISKLILGSISRQILGSNPRQILSSIHRYTVSIVSRIVLRYIFRFSGRRWIEKFSSGFRFSHLPSPLQNTGSVRKIY